MRRHAAGSAARVVVAAVAAAALSGVASPLSLSAGGAPTPLPSTRAPLPVASPVSPGRSPHAALDDLVAPPGTTSAVSSRDGGGFPDGVSVSPSISSTGRFVAFSSSATNIVPGGSSGVVSAVYLTDRTKGTTIELPEPGGGPIGEGASATDPSISGDGSVVAFVYHTPRQVAAGSGTVVIWDSTTGTTTGVSSQRLSYTDRSREPAVSANGHFVAFTSDGTGFGNTDLNKTSDVFRYDRTTGAMVLVSVGLDGTASADSTMPAISGDGSVVAFASTAGHSLVTDATGSGSQVFARDLQAGSTTLVSGAASGTAPDGEALEPSISDDGQFVAFSSGASNLVGGIKAGGLEVYRRDRKAGTTILVSSINGAPNQYPSRNPGISRDGRMVAYTVVQPAGALALTEGQVSEVYLADTTAGRTVLISVNLAGQPSPSGIGLPQVAGSGRFVAFASTGGDLVTGDDNQTADVFIRDLPPVPQLNPPKIDFGTRAAGLSPAIAAAVLVNAGWGPLLAKATTIGGTNTTDFAVVDDGCVGKALYGAEACTVTVGFTPTKAGARSATLRLPDSYKGSPRTALLTGRGSSAKIVLEPPMGPPGIVVIATGSGFPAGAQVQLTWSVGITAVTPIVTADDKGAFRVPVLVLRNDIVGPRNLVATSAGGPEFPVLQTPMIVTIASAAPPRFLGGGALPQTLVFRR